MTYPSELKQAIARLERLNQILGRARYDFLSLEAERKHFEARVVSLMQGKSHVEKLSLAQGTDDWHLFHKRLARAESVYEFEKLKLEIASKEWQSIYLELKLNDGLIKKQV